MGYIGDFGKLATGLVKSIPTAIDEKAAKVALKVGTTALANGVSDNSSNLFVNSAFRATKYGTYGAMGIGALGGVIGAIDQDKTVIGSTIGGVGLGAVGGGAAGVAVAIAKGIRK